MQIEYCFATVSDDVDVSWSMVVWVNHHPKSKKRQYSRHYINILSRLGYLSSFVSSVLADRKQMLSRELRADYQYPHQAPGSNVVNIGRPEVRRILIQWVIIIQFDGVVTDINLARGY